MFITLVNEFTDWHLLVLRFFDDQGAGSRISASECQAGPRQVGRLFSSDVATRQGHVELASLTSGDHGGHWQLELALCAVREIHAQPTRYAEWQRRDDDFVELILFQRAV